MLRKFFRKTPVAWLQITREKTRLAVALAGIAFADILMFVQLGFLDALFESAKKPYTQLDADLFLVNPQFESLIAVKSFTRERLYQAAGFDGVESITPLYLGTAQWRNPETRNTRSILVFGIDPADSAYRSPEIDAQLDSLKQLNQVIFDQTGRPEYGDIKQLLAENGTLSAQVSDIEVQVTGLFTLGTSFAADGNLLTSDSTFLRLFPERAADEVDVGLIRLSPLADVERVKAAIASALPDDVLVLTREELANRERDYWANSTPIGFVFGFGTIIGFIVGTVIVYQILYSDVSDHLPEYATLKAMGYGDSYLIGLLMQEALVLALLGFLPGTVLSMGLYSLAKSATLLPIGMTLSRAGMVLILTIVMCSGSGAIAMRKLQAADPADVF